MANQHAAAGDNENISDQSYIYICIFIQIFKYIWKFVRVALKLCDTSSQNADNEDMEPTKAALQKCTLQWWAMPMRW